MRVAFCSVSGVDDRQYWSGTPYFMAHHLSAVVEELLPIGPLQVFTQPFAQKNLLYGSLFKQGYLCELEPLLHSCLSSEVTRRLRTLGDIDVILSPGCFPYPNAFLDSKVPVVFDDSTVAGLLDINPNYRNLCPENTWCGDQLQQKMLDGATIAIFASDWAADSACQRYGISREKIRIIPFGANLDITINDEDELERVLSQREKDVCRLLLVARDWHGRNGDFATAVLHAVQGAGVRAKLIVLGCVVPDDARDAMGSDVEIHPHLTKADTDGERFYAAQLASGHFILHPSLSTCFGIAICEANGWATPALACRAGGVTSVVTDNNGFSFPPEASPQDYADKITTAWTDYEGYLSLCRSAWREYKTRLNWSSSARAVVKVLEDLI